MTPQDGLASPVAAGVPATAKRPTTLTAAVWCALVTSLLTLAGALTMIIAGKDSINEYITATAGADLAEAIQDASAAATEEAYQALVVKAGVAIGFGLLTLLFAALARGGATAARVGLAVVLVLGLCGGSGLQIVESDVLPAFSLVAAALTPLLSVAAIVLLFLPPSNRYAAARRRAS